ncbi:uncharacterized protein LOC118424879 [Branchiostoma floridae]|uniref:Uncharacterized protein LOC118424879 n=1 Tax=Branchiostoma floridae TaxID=7739 RepID=A0A9J7LWP8_BRAFL|nr:uncharacterized protein LOC118424879 [Branchiostoma floridae]
MAAQLNLPATSTGVLFSSYCHSLSDHAKVRYEEKVSAIGFDPYSLHKSAFDSDLALVPSVEYPDIVNYLVLTTSWATNNQMKAYKSMEAYNFFVSGWVDTLQMKTVSPDKVLVAARVKHSQRNTATPLKPWFLAEENGNILLAHCDCMAGVSEACSHIGAILFAAEVGARLRNSTSCTDVESYWSAPTYVRNIPYLPASGMDFQSAKKKHALLMENNVTPSATRTVPEGNTEAGTSCDEQKAFFQKLSESGCRPGILSLVAPFNEKYIPKDIALPKPIPEHYNPRYAELSFDELLEKCSEVNENLSLTPGQIHAIEESTRDQAKSNVWYRQRAGRITASNLKAACHSNPDKPSKSVVMGVCYPQTQRFVSPFTNWGQLHESTALKVYEERMIDNHEGFQTYESGLHINNDWPYLGATPDGLVECKCCGKGVCEMKCPFTAKDLLPTDLANTRNFCLKKTNDIVHLDRSHAYYYQVQAQMFICDVEYCDFVVWTKKGVFIERILPNAEFWDSATLKSKEFFDKAILPEIVGKWFSKTESSG